MIALSGGMERATDLTIIWSSGCHFGIDCLFVTIPENPFAHFEGFP